MLAKLATHQLLAYVMQLQDVIASSL